MVKKQNDIYPYRTMNVINMFLKKHRSRPEYLPKTIFEKTKRYIDYVVRKGDRCIIESVKPEYLPTKRGGVLWKDMVGNEFYRFIQPTDDLKNEFRFYIPVHKLHDRDIIRFYFIPLVPFVIIIRTTKRILKFIVEDILRCSYLIKEYNQKDVK